MKAIDDFFKANPSAPGLIKVGDCLYRAGSVGAARSHAKRFGLEVEEVPNPSVPGPDDAGEAKPARARKAKTKKA